MDNSLQSSLDFFKNEYHIYLDTSTTGTIKQYVLEILQTTRSMNRPSLDVEIVKRKIQDRINDLETSMVQGDTYGNVSGGFNNGLRPNMVEKKHIKKLELEEKLETLNNTIFEMESKLDLINNHARNIINKCCNKPEIIETLVCYFIHCKSVEFIADNTNSPNDTINTRKRRGIDLIVKKLQKM